MQQGRCLLSTLLLSTLLLSPCTGHAFDLFTGITHISVDELNGQQLRVNLEGDEELEYTLTTPNPNTLQLNFSKTRIALDLIKANGQVNIPSQQYFKKAFWVEDPQTQRTSLRLIGPNLAKKRLLLLGARPAEATSGKPNKPATIAFPSKKPAVTPPEPFDAPTENIFKATYTANAAHSKNSNSSSLHPPEPEETRFWNKEKEHTPSYTPSIASASSSTLNLPSVPETKTRFRPPHQQKTSTSATKASVLLATELDTLAQGSLPSALQQAQHWAKTNKTHQALALLQKLTKQHPKNALLSATLGELYLKESYPQLAFSAFQKALSISPNNKQQSIYLDRCAVALSQSNAPIKSLAQLRTLAQQYPDQSKQQFLMQLTLGVLSAQSGDHQQAQPYLERALQLNSHSAEAQYYMGLTQEFDGHLQTAQKHYQKALHLAPQFNAAKLALQRTTPI